MPEDIHEEPLLPKLVEGIRSFTGYVKDGVWSEVLIRVGIFLGLVVVFHFILVTLIESIIIPFLQMMVYDALLEEAQKRLGEVKWTDITESKNWKQLKKIEF